MMELKTIRDVMAESAGHKVKCTEKDGEQWTGYVDVFEDEYDNDENACSICVQRDDNFNELLFDYDIENIEIID